MTPRSPTQVQPDPSTPGRLLLKWNSEETFSLSYFELRFACPCAVCVDEKTGRRILTRDQVHPDVRPLAVDPIGRYALQFRWSDSHSTGMYHFDRLYELCAEVGERRS